MTIPRLTPICPDRLIVSLPYSEVVTRQPGAFVDDYQFNLNSIFDPNRTGIGHQPLGHDQWSQFYNRYRVISVDVIFEYINQNNETILLSLFPSNNTTTPNINDFLEQPYGSTGSLGNADGGRAGLTLQAHWECWKVTGRTRQEYLAGDQYQAQFGSSPSELLIIHSTAIQPQALTTMEYLSKAMIRYNVEIYDRVQLSSS